MEGVNRVSACRTPGRDAEDRGTNSDETDSVLEFGPIGVRSIAALRAITSQALLSVPYSRQSL